MEAQLKIAARLRKLADLSLADRVKAIALIYLEAGLDAAKEAARLANIPATRVEHRGRYALVDDVELVEERAEEVEDGVEVADDPVEEVEEEYLGRSILRRVAPWSLS